MKTTYRKLYKFHTKALAEDWLIKKNPQDVYDFYIIDEDKFYYNVIEDKKLIPQSGVGAVTVSENGVAKGTTSNVDFIDGDNTTFDVVKDNVSGKVKVKVNALGGGGTPAGSDTQIQYNNAGAFGADALFTRDVATGNANLAKGVIQQSTVTFTGSGLDGMNVAGSGYIGTTFPNTYTVEITQNNAQLWALSIINPGVFIPGETLTGLTSGETAFFVGYAGTNNDVIIVNSVSGTFTAFSEDIIGNLSGVTQQFNFAISTNSDVFTLTTSSGSSLGCTNAGSNDFTMGLDGVYPQFTSSSGYTVGDSWTWTYSNVQNDILDFSNGTYKFGTNFGTDYFGYEVGNNLLGAGITGSANTYTNVSGDQMLTGYADPTGLGFIGFASINTYSSGEIANIFANKNGVGYSIQDSYGENVIQSVSGVTTIGSLSGGNNTKITIDDVNEHITISNLPAYDDDTAAGVGGLTAGMVYMTTGSGSAPLNAAGILMIKQ
mgnify:CR=1 FL=1